MDIYQSKGRNRTGYIVDYNERRDRCMVETHDSNTFFIRISDIKTKEPFHNGERIGSKVFFLGPIEDNEDGEAWIKFMVEID